VPRFSNKTSVQPWCRQHDTVLMTVTCMQAIRCSDSRSKLSFIMCVISTKTRTESQREYSQLCKHVYICQTHSGSSSVQVASKTHCHGFHAEGLYRGLVIILGMPNFADVSTYCNSAIQALSRKLHSAFKTSNVSYFKPSTASQRLLQVLF